MLLQLRPWWPCRDAWTDGQQPSLYSHDIFLTPILRVVRQYKHFKMKCSVFLLFMTHSPTAHNKRAIHTCTCTLLTYVVLVDRSFITKAPITRVYVGALYLPSSTNPLFFTCSFLTLNVLSSVQFNILARSIECTLQTLHTYIHSTVTTKEWYLWRKREGHSKYRWTSPLFPHLEVITPFL